MAKVTKGTSGGEWLTALTRRLRQRSLPAPFGRSERRRYFSGNSVEIVTRNAFATLDVHERHVPFTALDATDVRAVQPALVGEALL